MKNLTLQYPYYMWLVSKHFEIMISNNVMKKIDELNDLATPKIQILHG